GPGELAPAHAQDARSRAAPAHDLAVREVLRRRPVACARGGRAAESAAPAIMLGAAGIWVAGIGAACEAGEIECEPLAVVAATSFIPSASPRWRWARAPSGCGPKTRPASPMMTPAIR